MFSAQFKQQVYKDIAFKVGKDILWRLFFIFKADITIK
jgi:hypothetical protein